MKVDRNAYVADRVLEDVGDLIVRQLVFGSHSFKALAIEHTDPTFGAKPQAPVRVLEATGDFVVGESLLGGEFLKGVSVETRYAPAVTGAPDVAVVVLEHVPHETAAKAVGGVVGPPVAGLTGRLGRSRPAGAEYSSMRYSIMPSDPARSKRSPQS